MGGRRAPGRSPSASLANSPMATRTLHPIAVGRASGDAGLAIAGVATWGGRSTKGSSRNDFQVCGTVAPAVHGSGQPGAVPHRICSWMARNEANGRPERRNRRPKPTCQIGRNTARCDDRTHLPDWQRRPVRSRDGYAVGVEAGQIGRRTRRDGAKPVPARADRGTACNFRSYGDRPGIGTGAPGGDRPVPVRLGKRAVDGGSPGRVAFLSGGSSQRNPPPPRPDRWVALR